MTSKEETAFKEAISTVRAKLRETVTKTKPLSKDHVSGSAVARRLIELADCVDGVAKLVESALTSSSGPHPY